MTTKLEKGADQAVLNERIQHVLTAFNAVKEYLPDNASRIEFDVEFVDGCRVKLEARA